MQVDMLNRSAGRKVSRIARVITTGALALVGAGILSGCQTASNALDTVTEALPFTDEVDIDERIIDRYLAEKAHGMALLKGPNCRSPESIELAATGTALERSYETQYGVLAVREVENYLNDILRRLQACLPGSPPKARVKVEVNPFAQYNARAARDGTIFLSLTAIEKAGTDDEIAMLIGHEYAHILLDHYGNIDLKEKRKQIDAVATLTAEVIDGVQAQQGGKQSGGKALDKAVPANFLIDYLIERPWGRKQEFEADLMGVELVYAAGFNPDEYAQFISRFSDTTPLEERLAQVDLIDEESLNEKLTSQPGNYRDIGKDLLWEGGEKLMKASLESFRDDHPSKEDRNEILFDYTELHEIFGDGINTGIGIERARKSKSFRNAVEAIRSSRTALQIAGDARKLSSASEKEQALNRAVTEARKSVSSSIGADKNPYTRLNFFDLRNEQGNKKSAALNLELALKAKEPPLMIFERLIEFHLGEGNKSAAKSAFNRAQSRFANSPYLLPLEIDYLVGAGDPENKLPDLIIKCRTHDDLGVSERCKKHELKAAKTS